MVFPGDQQPPSDPFAPAPPGQYGPGPINPGPMGPTSFQPAPASGGSAWKYLLIGCLAIIILGGVVTVGSCAYLASKGGSAMPKLIRFIKSEYVKDLTPDHTPEQRARFEQAYDFYADEAERLGFMEWINQYTEVMDQLTAIDGDQQITVEESQAWADMVLSGGGGTTEGAAPAGGEESYSEENAPPADGDEGGNTASDQPADENSDE